MDVKTLKILETLLTKILPTTVSTHIQLAVKMKISSNDNTYLRKLFGGTVNQ